MEYKMKNFNLGEDGVCSHLSFLDSNEINTLLNDINDFIIKEDVYNTSPQSSNRFDQMRAGNKAVVNPRFSKRDGDEGLIDVFNIDSVFSEESKTISEKIKTKNMETIKQNYPDHAYKFCSQNLYINKSVTKTRGFHRDSNIIPSRVKSFLYLTDVPDESFGPFCYIIGSHKGESQKYPNSPPHSAEYPLNEEDKDNCFVFKGIQKGDMLMGLVVGAHRGLPQHKGRLRIVLVSSYDPK